MYTTRALHAPRFIPMHAARIDHPPSSSRRCDYANRARRFANLDYAPQPCSKRRIMLSLCLSSHCQLTVDGIRPRPFNEVHEIHKPSRELGHLGVLCRDNRHSESSSRRSKRAARDTATNYER